MADDSISLQLDSSLRDPTPTRPQVSPIPFRLLEPQTTKNPRKEATENGRTLDTEFAEYGEKEIRILGQSMCLKRRRESSSSSWSSSISMSSSLKRVSVETDLEARRSAVRSSGDAPLHVADPDIFEIMEKDKQRQYKGIELIASENFACRAVIETLCCDRALSAFGLDSENWGVNVQPYLCTPSNFAVYTGLLYPGDRIMGLDTPSGGNTSHGYYTPNGKKVSGASIFFESLPYKVKPQPGYIDFDKLQERALDFRPKMLICGGSSYPRE